MTLSACYRCIPKGAQGEVGIYLVDRINQAGLCKTPGPITLNAPASTNGGGFTLSWVADPVAAGYRIDISTDPAFGSFYTQPTIGVNYQNFDVGNVTTYVVGGLVGNTPYYVRVRGYNKTCTGPNSNVVTTTTLMLHWNPEASPATWTDKNGNFTDVYANFALNADLASLTSLNVAGTITDVTNAGGIPLIASLNFAFGSMVSYEMNGLLRIGGNFTGNNATSFTTLSASTLANVTGNVDFNSCTNVGFTNFTIPALKTVTGRIQLNADTTLQTLSLPALTTLGGTLNVNGCTAMTTLSAPLLSSAGQLTIATTGIVNLSFNSLTQLKVNSTTNLAVGTACLSISLPVLVSSYGLSLCGANTTSLSLPSLSSVGSSLIINNNKVNPTIEFPSLLTVFAGITINACSLATSVRFPLMTQSNGYTQNSASPNVATVNLNSYQKSLGSFSISGQNALTSLMLDSFQSTVSSLTITNSALATISMPSFTTCPSNATFAGVAALTTFTAPNYVVASGAFTATWANDSLGQTSVDNILCQAANGGTTGGTTIITINGGLNATPSAAGKACTDTLRGRGVTCNLNGY